MGDRQKIKDNQKGVYGVINGVSSAAGAQAAVEQMHEETFVFQAPAGSPFAEAGIAVLKACKVKSIRVTAGTTLAADATNNITATVAKRDGAGGSATTIGAVTTNVAGGALTAFVPKTADVSSTAGVALLAAGNVLTFKTADNGTTTEPALTCSVTVEYV
jgi:hypothetical protein